MVVCCQPSFRQRFQILTGGLSVHPVPRTRGHSWAWSRFSNSLYPQQQGRRWSFRRHRRNEASETRARAGTDRCTFVSCWLAGWSGQPGVHQAANLSGQSQRSGIEFGRGSVIALVILVWGAKTFKDEIVGPWTQTLSQNNGEQRVDQTFRHHGAMRGER